MVVRPFLDVTGAMAVTCGGVGGGVGVFTLMLVSAIAGA